MEPTLEEIWPDSDEKRIWNDSEYEKKYLEFDSASCVRSNIPNPHVCEIAPRAVIISIGSEHNNNYGINEIEC